MTVLARSRRSVLAAGTVVLAAATGTDSPREGTDFFPLTVEVEERYYAAGKIPGGWFRREARPSTDAILTDRLTDRPLRPLFPKGYRNEVQIVCTILSADQENDYDVFAINGASAAVALSDIPWNGPVGACRVGYTPEGEYLINPTFEQRETSLLDRGIGGKEFGEPKLGSAGRIDAADG